MWRRQLLERVALTAPLISSVAAGPAKAAGERDPALLDQMLQPYLASHGLPAFAAAVVRKGAVVAAGAVGTRRAGTDTPVTVDDRFHIGSDTKAMTSLVAATLVEEDRIGWGIAALPYSVEPFLTHSGSNTMNLATIMVQPSRDYGAVLATNVGGVKADQAIQAVAEQLYKQFGPGRD